MPKTNIYDMTGKQVGEIELNDAVFGVEPNKVVMHEVVKNHLANLRQGTQSTLTRAEVNGGGRKPWRQKGTGRARQGSTRSPQWTHGGIALGPKPRDYSYSVNKKVKRLALKSALSSKVNAGELIIIDEIKSDEIKTKTIVGFLKAINAENGALIATAEANRNVVLGARNIQGVKTTIATTLSVYDLLKYEKFVLDTAAVEKITEVYA